MTQAELQKLSQSLPDGDLIRSLARALIVIAVDGALPIDVDGSYLITKASAIALTVAAPGAAGIGRRITLLSGSDFAHVVTFTGSTLQNGAGAAKLTWTTSAVQGCGLTIVGVTATKWSVESTNLGVLA